MIQLYSIKKIFANCLLWVLVSASKAQYEPTEMATKLVVESTSCVVNSPCENTYVTYHFSHSILNYRGQIFSHPTPFPAFIYPTCMLKQKNRCSWRLGVVFCLCLALHFNAILKK